MQSRSSRRVSPWTRRCSGAVFYSNRYCRKQRHCDERHWYIKKGTYRRLCKQYSHRPIIVKQEFQLAYIAKTPARRAALRPFSCTQTWTFNVTTMAAVVCRTQLTVLRGSTCRGEIFLKSRVLEKVVDGKYAYFWTVSFNFLRRFKLCPGTQYEKSAPMFFIVFYILAVKIWTEK